MASKTLEEMDAAGALTGAELLYVVQGGDSKRATLSALINLLMSTPPAPPANTVAPVITGTPQVGVTLTCSTGTWTNSPTGYAFLWIDSISGAIPGATAATYVPTAGNVDHTLRCTVTATNAGGSTNATSAATGAVAAAPPGIPANTVLPAITGTAQVGQTLTCSNGTWTNSPTGYTRQWTDSTSGAIFGATNATYTPVTGNIGHTLTCTVTATNVSGSTSATSAATSVVVMATPSSFVHDTFTDVDATALTAHVGETGATWTQHSSYGTGTASILSNAAKGDTTNKSLTYASGSPPADGNYSVAIPISKLTNLTLEFGPVARIDTASDRWIAFVWNKLFGVDGGFGIVDPSGVEAQVVQAIADGDVMTLCVHGNPADTVYPGLRIRGLVNSTEVVRYGYFNNALPYGATAGKAGLYFKQNADATHGHLVREFTAVAFAKKITYDGDSLSTSYGVSLNGYAEQLTGLLGATWFDTMKAVDGRQFPTLIAEAASKIDPQLDLTRVTNVLSVWCGRNDLATGSSATIVYANFITYVNARKAAGWTNILVGTAAMGAEFADFPALNAERLSFNTMVRNGAAGLGVILADFALDSHFDSVGDENNATYYADRIHFTQAGYAILAGIAHAALVAAGVASAAPVNTVLPAITGTAEVGLTLTCSTGTWTGSPTFAYQWIDTTSGAISGATNATYVPVTGNIDHTLTCRVTGTNAGGSTPATSAATGAVVASSSVVWPATNLTAGWLLRNVVHSGSSLTNWPASGGIGATLVPTGAVTWASDGVSFNTSYLGNPGVSYGPSTPFTLYFVGNKVASGDILEFVAAVLGSNHSFFGSYGITVYVTDVSGLAAQTPCGVAGLALYRVRRSAAGGLYLRATGFAEVQLSGGDVYGGLTYTFTCLGAAPWLDYSSPTAKLLAGAFYGVDTTVTGGDAAIQAIASSEYGVAL